MNVHQLNLDIMQIFFAKNIQFNGKFALWTWSFCSMRHSRLTFFDKYFQLLPGWILYNLFRLNVHPLNLDIMPKNSINNSFQWKICPVDLVILQRNLPSAICMYVCVHVCTDLVFLDEAWPAFIGWISLQNLFRWILHRLSFIWYPN